MIDFQYDVAVLGGGSAGYAAARTTAGAGLKTVVIDGGEEVGGLCILRGCMPSKALLYAAEVRHLAQKAGTWGLKIPTVGFDLAAVMQRKGQRIGEFAGYRRSQLESGKFQFFRASARFTDPHTLALEPLASAGGAGKKADKKAAGPRLPATLTARHFIVATGSVITPPTLPGLQEAGYLTSDDALVLKKLPKTLIVLGGGATACELAQFFARFDVKVTLLQRSPHVLKAFDDDAAKVVEDVFMREGINVITGVTLLSAGRKVGRKTVTFEHAGKRREIAAEEILYSLGRSPNTSRLGLEAAGVKTEAGRIVTNGRMRTSAPHIYAAGDCTGPHEIVHIAIQQAEIAAHNILKPKTARQMDYRLLISVVFTDPQMAVTGLTEKTAAEQGIPFVTASYPFNDHGKSLIMEALDGFVKLLAHPRTGEILGGCCVGPMGGELIHEITAAMAGRMTVRELAVMPHYHPTLAEIWTYPAEELADKIGI